MVLHLVFLSMKFSHLIVTLMHGISWFHCGKTQISISFSEMFSPSQCSAGQSCDTVSKVSIFTSQYLSLEIEIFGSCADSINTG